MHPLNVSDVKSDNRRRKPIVNCSDDGCLGLSVNVGAGWRFRLPDDPILRVNPEEDMLDIRYHSGCKLQWLQIWNFIRYRFNLFDDHSFLLQKMRNVFLHCATKNLIFPTRTKAV